jgi:hypothetical protein
MPWYNPGKDRRPPPAAGRRNTNVEEILLRNVDTARRNDDEPL